jgi:hypothetical protein
MDNVLWTINRNTLTQVNDTLTLLLMNINILNETVIRKELNDSHQDDGIDEEVKDQLSDNKVFSGNKRKNR